MRCYQPKYFRAEELVDPQTFAALGNRSLMLLDPGILCALDAVREMFGKTVVVNNWHIGGSFRQRGYRPWHSTTGAPYSQHRLGRAIDFHIPGMTPDEIRLVILRRQHEIASLVHITAMEDATPTWVHIDSRNIPDTDIHVFKP